MNVKKHEGESPDRREQILYLPLSAIDKPLVDARQTRDFAYIERLSTDLAASGMKHPLRVEAHAPGKYRIRTGENRRQAALLAGFTEVPCIVLTGEPLEEDILLDQLSENEFRSDMNDVDRGETYLRVMAKTGWNQAELAKRIEAKPGTVNKILAVVTRLDAEVRAAVREGKIPYTAACSIARLPDAERQRAIAKRYLDGLLSRDGVVQAVARELAGKKPVRSKIRAKTLRGVELAIPPMGLDDLLAELKTIADAIKRLAKNGLSLDVLPDLLKTKEVTS